MSENGKKYDIDENWGLLTEKEQRDLQGLLDHPGMDALFKVLDGRKENLVKRLTKLDNQVKMYRFQGRIAEYEMLDKYIRGILDRITKEKRNQIRKEQQEAERG